jgi:hypothetical protein
VPVTEMIARRELRWFGHLYRMDNNRMPSQVWERRVKVMRGRGRARIKWEQHM